MKLGRNDPCPCGSGKKYKKCCLEKQKDVDQFLDSDQRWTVDKVESMDTPTIIQILIACGIPVSVEKFKDEIKKVPSIENLFNDWEKIYPIDTKEPSADFIYLAIKVLASRLAPEHLLLEQIGDRMEEGYEKEALNDETEAAEIWLDVWNKMLKWLGNEKITDISQLNEKTGPSFSSFFSNWVQDFEMNLSNAGELNAKYFVVLEEYTREFIERFPDSSSLILHNMMVANGEALFELGKYEEAENVFQEQAKKSPDNIWTYTRWGDLYNPIRNSTAPNPDYAVRLYKKAVEKATSPNDRKDIESRIDQILKEYQDA